MLHPGYNQRFLSNQLPFGHRRVQVTPTLPLLSYMDLMAPRSSRPNNVIPICENMFHHDLNQQFLLNQPSLGHHQIHARTTPPLLSYMDLMAPRSTRPNNVVPAHENMFHHGKISDFCQPNFHSDINRFRRFQRCHSCTIRAWWLRGVHAQTLSYQCMETCSTLGILNGMCKTNLYWDTNKLTRFQRYPSCLI